MRTKKTGEMNISDIKVRRLKQQINFLIRIRKKKINLTYQMPHLYFTKLFALFSLGSFLVGLLAR